VTTPLRVPGEMAQPIKDHLAAVLPGLAGVPAVSVSLGVPRDWTPTKSNPHIGVFDDSGPMQWPIVASHRLRVVVWSNSRTLSRLIAGRCLGVVLAQKIAGIANVIDPSTLTDGRDPINTGTTAEFYATVRVRTVAV
jgi:hypothetical protein